MSSLPFRLGNGDKRMQPGQYNRRLAATTTTIAVGSSLLLLAGCKPEAKSSAVLPQPIRVMTVGFAPLTATRSYTGVIKPRVESDLGFRVAGKITERLVDVGRRIKEGDVIARLDATDLKLALEVQEAELRAATSTRDQAAAAQQRYRELLEKGHVSTAALEQRTATADEARQRVEKATRAVATARNQIAYTELKADAAGIIATLPAEVGQVVTAGQTIARVARTGELEVQVAVPEQQLDELRTSKATVELWSNGAFKYDAVLREVSPEADNASRTYQARYTIANADPRVALGMTATVKLAQAGGAVVARLPLPAVMNDGRDPSVFVVDSAGTAIKRTPVEVILFGRDDVVIGGGLVEGQRVVTLGTHQLDETRPVRIVEMMPPAASQARSAGLAH
jgi:membrane fusion protein, multidrug efflux system